MTGAAAWLYAVLCAGIAGFNLALVLGAPWGHLTQGGFAPGALPRRKRVVAALSVLLVGAMALAVLSQGIGWPGWPRWTGWVAVALGVVTLVLNAVTPSRAERRLWLPVAGLALICALVVMGA